MDDSLPISPTPSLPPPQSPLLPRRNSTAAPFPVPTALILPRLSPSSATSSFSGGLDLKPLLSYTSLKDLLPTTMACNSPKPNSPANHLDSSGSHIPIRNRLVKQAAWAYLQPMSTPTGSNRRTFLRRLWDEFPRKNPVVGAVFRFFRRYVFHGFSRVLDWLLRAVRIPSYR